MSISVVCRTENCVKEGQIVNTISGIWENEMEDFL